jgi:hypothetical protein
VLIVGDDVVAVQGSTISVGNLVKYRVSEVEHAAHHAVDLHLPNGAILQAAVARLVVGAQQQAEDYVLLSKRVADYERRQGG